MKAYELTTGMNYYHQGEVYAICGISETHRGQVRLTLSNFKDDPFMILLDPQDEVNAEIHSPF